MLDRETVRALAHELRRAEAVSIAVRALRYRDLSRGRLEERMVQRGAGEAARAEALETLERSGLVDDGRVASSRALALAARGFGDAAIRERLEQEGLAGEALEAALCGLAPESERAGEWLERRGRGPKTLRWLAAKGFDTAVLEDPDVFADEA